MRRRRRPSSGAVSSSDCTKFGRMQDALLTTVVGSYPQPDWLVDRAMLGSRLPPRTRALEIWRVAGEFLEQAQDDATVLAIRDMERAGIDIITDGEIRRESYSNRFATVLDGMDLDNPGTALDRTGHPNPVTRVVGPIRRAHAVEQRDVEFLRATTTRRIKATLPGPFGKSAAVRREGDQPGVGGHRWDDRPSHVLRVCAHRPRAACGLSVPGGAGGCQRETDLAGVRPAERRPVGVEEPFEEDADRRRDRPVGR